MQEMFICYSTYRLEAWDRAEHNFPLIELMLLVEWRSALLVGELFDASAGPFHKTRSWTLKFNSFCRRKHNVQKKNKFSVHRKKFTKINSFWDLEKSKREKLEEKWAHSWSPMQIWTQQLKKHTKLSTHRLHKIMEPGV